MTVVSLTSIPTRFEYLPQIVENLLKQNGSPTIYVCIPDKYSRFPDVEVVPPVFNNDRVKVLRGKDYGPATKFIAPALVLPDDEKIVYLDDDTDYPACLAETLARYADDGTVWGLSGFIFSEYFSYSVTRHHAKDVDVIEGYGGVCIKAGIIKNNLNKILEMLEVTYNDDIALSNVLKYMKVPVRTLLTPECNGDMLNQYQFGFGPDALHHNNGEGTHTENNKRILKALTDKNINYFKYNMLVDCFMFYNELDVLEARLTLLDKYVDMFVLVEAEVTHLGGRKALYFEQNKERFKKWLPKIRYVLAKDMPSDQDPWSREKHQRNCIMDGLTDVPDDAIVMVSDVDEIPDMRRIRYEKLPHSAISIHMHMFEYSLKYYFTEEAWFGTVVTCRGLLAQYGPNYLRDNRQRLPAVKLAGWHLSSFGDWEHVYKKFSTYAHALDDTTAKDPEVYRRNVAEGLWGGKQMPPPPPESIPPLPTELLARFNHTPT
jgi:beta-1,4-mannosyl-glycoprotein beta-1,4-N-acetylglucosaminyltransferase